MTMTLPLGDVDAAANRPLADRMRPASFDEVLGQDHLLAKGGLLREAMRTGRWPSVLFWGPPGCGKTTMARLIATESDARFVQVSAISEATKELRKIFAQAEADQEMGRQTLLFVDEIHRFNRAQQDLFLPYIEKGAIILVGATTENPSFELNNALLSRCQVLVLKLLDEPALAELVTRSEAELGQKLPLTDGARAMLLTLAEGDGRYLLNLIERLSVLQCDALLDETKLLEYVQQRAPVYDKGQDGHYNGLSAFHKSMRASDVDAALYWAARMLQAGEKPETVLRRMVACASEDVGMADPQALVQALAAKDAYEFLGMPEAFQCIGQAIIYIASAPKSNAAYMAFKAARAVAKEGGNLMPPKHAMNAPTKLMEAQGHGDGYIYDHDTAGGFSGQSYLPDEVARSGFYQPVERGFERDMKKRMDYWAKLRKYSVSPL